MNRPHSRPRPCPIRRALRVALAHAILQLADPHLWNAAALAAIAGLAALPPDFVAAHTLLKIAMPAALAIGVTLRARQNHQEACQKAAS